MQILLAALLLFIASRMTLGPAGFTATLENIAREFRNFQRHAGLTPWLPPIEPEPIILTTLQANLIRLAGFAIAAGAALAIIGFLR